MSEVVLRRPAGFLRGRPARAVVNVLEEQSSSKVPCVVSTGPTLFDVADPGIPRAPESPVLDNVKAPGQDSVSQA